MGDLFDSSLDLEERQIAEGREQGLREGTAAGVTESLSLGHTRGFSVGYEAGVYRGRNSRAVALPPRAEATVAALEQALATLRVHDPQDEAILENLEAARGKFRKVLAMLDDDVVALLPLDITAAAATAAANAKKPTTTDKQI